MAHPPSERHVGEHSSDTVREIALKGWTRVRRGLEGTIAEWQERENAFPRFSYTTGSYDFVNSYDPSRLVGYQWIGFLAGKLWLMYVSAGDGLFEVGARRCAEAISSATDMIKRPNIATFGGDIFYGLCVGHNVTKDDTLASAATSGATGLMTLFDPDHDVFYQSRAGSGPVIDTANTLNSLYWCNDDEMDQLLHRHLQRIMASGMIREDHSSFQALRFGEGDDTRLATIQGYADQSTWARGQAWGIHNFVNAYEATEDERYLNAGLQMCRWYIAQTPAGTVPPYDFDDPGEVVPIDTCAASLVLNAVVRMVKWGVADAGWENYAYQLLASLVNDHLTIGGVLLDSSWGRIHQPSTSSEFIDATESMGRFPRQDVMPYGNYWLAEALYRVLHEDWSPLRLRMSEARG